MPILYDYINHDGYNPFKEWSQSLEKTMLAKLNQKIDMLELHGANLPPGLFSDSNLRHIKKFRINGKIAIRPLLCRGPIDMRGEEFTLLAGATEKDRKLLPGGILETADNRRQQIISDPRRRTKHERIS